MASRRDRDPATNQQTGKTVDGVSFIVEATWKVHHSQDYAVPQEIFDFSQEAIFRARQMLATMQQRGYHDPQVVVFRAPWYRVDGVLKWLPSSILLELPEEKKPVQEQIAVGE